MLRSRRAFPALEEIVSYLIPHFRMKRQAQFRCIPTHLRCHHPPRARMPTIRLALAGLEQQLFSGRLAELTFFREWLDIEGEPLGILYVSGPGGSGKSTLVA